MKKKGLAILGMMLLLVLLLSTTQAFAFSYGVSDKKATQEDKTKNTPGAQATDRAIDKQTDPPGNSENAPGQNKTKENNGNAFGKSHQQDSTGRKEHFKGTIGFVDVANATINVNLDHGDPIALLIDRDTVIKIPTMKKAAQLSDLVIGMKVTVQAYHTQQYGLVVEAINVIPGEPAKIHRVGTVVTYTSSQITILGSDGLQYSFLVNETTKVLPDGAEILPGAWVTIIAPRDVTYAPLTAAGIVLHAKPTAPAE